MALLCGIASGYMDWTPLAFLAVLISWLGISLFYMASKFLMRSDWEARAKTELSRMVFTSILIVGIFFIAEAGCTAIDATVQGDPFLIAKDHIKSIYFNDLVPASMDLWTGALESRKAAGVRESLIYCYFGACYNPYAGFNYLASDFESASTIFASFGASLISQYFFLDVIKQLAFSLFLPAGIILKAFPFMRDAGAFLISLALGFYFVFPLFYVMDSLALSAIGKPTYNAIYNSIDLDNSAFGISLSTAGISNYITLSLITIIRIASLLPQVAVLPLLALITSTAAMRAVYEIVSKDYIEEVYQ